jgi:hypothetical protein
MPRSAKIALGLAAMLAGIAGLYFWTSSMGRAALREYVAAEGYCVEPACDEAVSLVHQIMREEYGVSDALLDWCVGVDKWAETRVRRGAWFRNAAVWVMYLPCGEMGQEA